MKALLLILTLALTSFNVFASSANCSEEKNVTTEVIVVTALCIKEGGTKKLLIMAHALKGNEHNKQVRIFEDGEIISQYSEIKKGKWVTIYDKEVSNLHYVLVQDETEKHIMEVKTF